MWKILKWLTLWNGGSRILRAMAIVTEVWRCGYWRSQHNSISRNSKHINDAVLQTHTTSDRCRSTRSWPRTDDRCSWFAATGWPEKTNPGADGDRPGIRGREESRAASRRTGYPLDHPPPETRYHSGDRGGGEQSGVDAEAEGPAKQPILPANGRERSPWP